MDAGQAQVDQQHVGVLIVTEDPDQPFITVKAEPADVQALVAEHDSVQPGRYLNKRHWITATPGPDITLDLVQALVQDSYDLVVESLPARDRPAGRCLRDRRSANGRESPGPADLLGGSEGELKEAEGLQFVRALEGAGVDRL